MHTFLLVCFSTFALGQKPESLGLDCCRRIRVSASSIMTTFQPLAVGIYEATGGKMNNRLVYKHKDVDLFAYYYNWGRRQVGKMR